MYSAVWDSNRWEFCAFWIFVQILYYGKCAMVPTLASGHRLTSLNSYPWEHNMLALLLSFLYWMCFLSFHRFTIHLLISSLPGLYFNIHYFFSIKHFDFCNIVLTYSCCPFGFVVFFSHKRCNLSSTKH